MGALVAYVDIDDTLVRSVGAKRIPMPEMLRHVRDLHGQGFTLYAWSSGGGDYARSTASELGLLECFTGFLPKPNILIDDQKPAEWRRLVWVHPLQAPGKVAADYLADLDRQNA